MLILLLFLGEKLSSEFEFAHHFSQLITQVFPEELCFFSSGVQTFSFDRVQFFPFLCFNEVDLVGEAVDLVPESLVLPSVFFLEKPDIPFLAFNLLVFSMFLSGRNSFQILIVLLKVVFFLFDSNIFGKLMRFLIFGPGDSMDE